MTKSLPQSGSVQLSGAQKARPFGGRLDAQVADGGKKQMAERKDVQQEAGCLHKSEATS